MSRSGNGISRYSHLPLCLYLLTTSSLLADVIPGRWEKLEAQPLGLEIVVVLQGGQRVEAEFRGLSPDHLAIEIGSGEERQLLTQEILRVQGPVESYRNSGRYGLVIGAAVGFSISAATVLGENDLVGSAQFLFTSGIMAATATGGWLISKAIKKREILYKAPGLTP